MTDIAVVPIREVRQATTLFWDLRYHRTHVLEGLRRTASRNMRHFEGVCRQEPPPTDAKPDGAPSSEWIERVQARTLGDQGLPDTPANRAILPYATFLPVRAYYAALHAELHFLQRHGRAGGLLHDPGLESVLSGHSDLIDRLGSFRDGLLHPRESSATDEVSLVRHNLHHKISGLQEEIDGAIERIRADLRVRVEAIVDQLPETQSLFCRWSSIKHFMEDPLLPQDSVYGLNLESELDRIVGRLSRPPKPDEIWSPSAHQQAAARKIIKMLIGTFPV